MELLTALQHFRVEYGVFLHVRHGVFHNAGGENGRELDPCVRSSISHFRCFRRQAISRFLASYFATGFSRLFTLVHTPFQRVFGSTSHCDSTHLARSPQRSTCAINMNDNNLRECSLLRVIVVVSTLPTPRVDGSSANRHHIVLVHSQIDASNTAIRATAPLQPTRRIARVSAAHVAAEGHAR
jgi:hypothetical protein